MSRLTAEHQRLFAASPGGPLPAARDARVRTLVLALHSPADWAALRDLFVELDFNTAARTAANTWSRAESGIDDVLPFDQLLAWVLGRRRILYSAARS